MTKTKTNTKDFDCVEVKRRAQRELLDELDGHSPNEQYEIIRRIAEELPLWKELRKAKRKTAPRSTTDTAKRTKTG